jgi:hypothetical protein
MTTRSMMRLGCCVWLCAGMACGSGSKSSDSKLGAGAAGAPAESTAMESGADDTSPGDSQGSGDSSSMKPGAQEPSKADDSMAAEPKPGAAMDGSKTPAGDPSNANSGDKNAIDWNGDIRGHCDLKTQFPGDESCIPAPPADQGMQIHIGPTDYDDPDQIAKFVMHPGEESSECYVVETPNDQKVYYQTWTLSGRSGTHHIITNLFDDTLETGGFKACASEFGGSTGPMRLGTAPGASKPYMPRGVVAPEYEHVGKTIPAHAHWQSDMHYYNFTDHDILREFWVNIYYVKAEDITQEADQIVGFGGLGWNRMPIAPQTDKVYSYSCPIKGEGSILSLLGHYHAHGTRFTASIKRVSGQVDKVFEMYSYLEPAIFEYNSVIDNPAFSDAAAGATSGVLNVHDGDALLWDCHIVNDSDVGLTYTNAVKTGEMCNVWGTSVGVDPISCFLQ